MKTCPFCAEEIQDAAIVCKHCGRDLNPTTPPPIPGPTAASTQTSATGDSAGRARRVGLLTGAIGFILTLASSATVPFGIILLWVGIGLAMKGGAIARWGGGFILALVLGMVGMMIGGTQSSSSPSGPASGAVGGTAGSTPPTSAPPSKPPETTYELALISARGSETEGGGFHVVEGQVKNITDQPLKNVTAVATWYAKDDTFVKTDDALIDYNPILPGQTSPFKTMSSSNPAMTKYTVEFKHLFGGTLGMRDDRKR